MSFFDIFRGVVGGYTRQPLSNAPGSSGYGFGRVLGAILSGFCGGGYNYGIFTNNDRTNANQYANTNTSDSSGSLAYNFGKPDTGDPNLDAYFLDCQRFLLNS